VARKPEIRAKLDNVAASYWLTLETDNRQVLSIAADAETIGRVLGIFLPSLVARLELNHYGGLSLLRVQREA
jgi:hypothetical protein